MRLTKEHLEAAKSSNGAWSRKQLKLLKVDFTKTGWKYRAMNRDHHPDDIAEFIALKDAHLVNGFNVYQRRRAKKNDPEIENEQERLQRLKNQIDKPEDIDE